MRIAAMLAIVAAGVTMALSFSPLQAEDAKKVKCIVSGKEMDLTPTTKSIMANGQAIYFCCDNCPKAFTASPEKFVKNTGKCPVNPDHASVVSVDNRVVINNSLYYVCCPGCPANLSGKPATFVKDMKDPVTGKAFKAASTSPTLKHEGQVFVFADATSKTAFEKEPAKYAWIYKK